MCVDLHQRAAPERPNKNKETLKPVLRYTSSCAALREAAGGDRRLSAAHSELFHIKNKSRSSSKHSLSHSESLSVADASQMQ